VRVGDALLLNASGQSEDPAARALAFPEPQLLGQVKVGERVILDDGRLIAMVEAKRSDGLLCRVKHAVKSPIRLRSGKGIAFPDSELSLHQLGPQDEIALEFALEHADGVGVSLVNTPQDVALVGERLRQKGKPGFGMILKLETRGAMRNLAAILFEALKHDPVGLMIARGDLAVELSFEKLAEMQEELLWFGEACHLTVIWATQVLDSVAHSGLPTRAEVTDAAMSMRAECVMLNKGPYIAAATSMLVDIIRKMESHQYKKRSLYRPLSWRARRPEPARIGQRFTSRELRKYLIDWGGTRRRLALVAARSAATGDGRGGGRNHVAHEGRRRRRNAAAQELEKKQRKLKRTSERWRKATRAGQQQK
jgi:pyruvate kinase